MIFTKEIWEDIGLGYVVYDCAVQSRNRQCFILVEDRADPHRDPLPRTRFVFTYNDEIEPRERCYFRGYPHFNFAHVAFTGSPAPSYVAVDLGGTVYSYDRQRDGEEAMHPRALAGTTLSNVLTNVVRVGETIFTVGGPRRVYRRAGIDRWQDTTSALPIPKDFIATRSNMADFYWKDLAGFSEVDMYAAGGAGEVWRFDGREWEQLFFPSNERLFNVSCAGDGNVYIGGNMGSLYVGRGNRWKRLVEGDFSVPFKDIAWFAGKLWCGSEYGLWELKDGALVRAEIPAEVHLVSGAIDINPEQSLMLTAGPNGAALFDGKTWDVLFSRFELE